MEKAYDTIWRYGILRDLQELGLKGRLPIFIKSFLAERTIQVRVGSTLSVCVKLKLGMSGYLKLKIKMINNVLHIFKIIVHALFHAILCVVNICSHVQR